MTNHKLKLITTQDGSHSLMREDMNETYHSFHGARSESEYVFIDKGLEFISKTTDRHDLKVFEVGLGTGLNAYLSALWTAKTGRCVKFHSLEPIPVPSELYTQFNFGKEGENGKLLQQIHDAPWESLEQICELFYIHKCETTLQEYVTQEQFDVVFFDAFAPSKQAEVWALENIQKCFDLLRPGGILTTYCAQGQFKRNMATVGFDVETLKGAMGKKEMVRGKKPIG